MSCFNICPHCGANLDSGESCDCFSSRYALLNAENRRKMDAYIGELLAEQKTPAGAANTDEGKAEQVLTGSDSASTINENGGFVK